MKKTQEDIPEFTEMQFRYLKRVFPELEITPESTVEEIMYNAGRQSVLKLIEKRVQAWKRVEIT